MPIAILRDLGISRVRLLSKNPQKSRFLIDVGIEVVEQVSCEAPPNPHSFAYQRAKKEEMGHALSLGNPEGLDSVKQARVDVLGRLGESGGALTSEQSAFASIEVAIRELKAGRMIVVDDDEDREIEGDLMMAAEMIAPDAINFMTTHGRGLVCLAMTGERLDESRLAPMTPDNTALGGTGFTVSIDAKGRGMTTGISARDRAQTIRTAIDARRRPEDFARPGHVFPLRSRVDGILDRRGHTEAAVDLARLAGLHPSGVICVILNHDGTMARVPDLVQFCRVHQLKMIAIADLTRYRLENDNEGLCEAIEGLDPAFALRSGDQR